MVSVLFVDLVGFTSFSEGKDPEDVRSMITDYFDLAREVIDRFGGTVDKFIGDAVMAWWGATTSNEDDAERAVRSSLELVDRVKTMGEVVGIEGLAARVGVMTGEVSVGPGGNERGLLLGDLVNIASRLQSLADAGTVLVGETTASLVGSAIDLSPAGTHQLKGRAEPVTAFRADRVIGERGGKGRSDFLEPPFVGRTAEVRLLKDALHATGRESHARLVSLIGQAGIGKSRLVWEFLKYIDGLVEVVYWHEGRSPSYGDGVAMWALGEMIRQRAGITETDDDDTTRQRLEDVVSQYISHEPDRAWVSDRLAALLGVGSSVGAERTELFAAARLLFEGIATQGTVVLVFEDLHWADPALLEFIDEFPDWSHNHPILIVTLSRPDLLDRRPEWGSGRRGFSSTYLAPLADDEIRDMLEGAVPGIPTDAADRIVGAAGGVPLFAVEMLRMLVAEGRLLIGAAGVEVTDDLSHLDVPSSVQAVVAARLDRLASEEREIVRDASVLGQSFTVDSLAGLREESVDKVERRLGDLVRREIFELVRDPRSPERGQYRWVQSVLREVAYGRISKSDRHLLHLQVARQLRSLEEPELAPVVAAHFVAATEASGEDEPQLQHELADALRAAIARAQVLHAHEQILGLVDSTLAVVSTELEMDLREIGALAAVRLSRVDDADRHATAAMALAEVTDDPVLLHRAVALGGRVDNQNRNPRRAAEILEPHLTQFPDVDADPNLARAAVYLARTRLLLGDKFGAAELADRALGAAERFDLVEDIADAMVTRGTALAFSQPRHGIVLLRGALALAREHDLSDVMLRCLINIGYGGPDIFERRQATQEAFDEAKRIGDRSHASFVAGNLATYFVVAMEHDRLEALIADPLWPTEDGDNLGLHAELAYRRGDVDRANALVDEAEAMGADAKNPQTLLGLERTHVVRAFFEGRGRDVFAIGKRHFEESPFAKTLSVSIAMEGASIERDPEMLAEVASFIETVTDRPLRRGMQAFVEGLQALGAGDIADGLELTERAISQFEALGMRWVAFETMVLAAAALPAEHNARAELVARARQLAEETGAPGLLTWIDRMIA